MASGPKTVGTSVPVCEGVIVDDAVVVRVVDEDAVCELVPVMDGAREPVLVALAEEESDAPVDHDGELVRVAVIVIEAVTVEDRDGDVGNFADNSQQNVLVLSQRASFPVITQYSFPP